MTSLAAAGATQARSAAPAPVFSGRLYSVAAVSADDAWADGLTPSGAQIVNWNGQTWTQSLTTDFGYFLGVAADSADDAWAVGGTYWFSPSQTLAEHWNGTSWAQVPTPTPAGGGVLNAVAATSPSNAWAVGLIGGGAGSPGPTTPLIEQWNGTTWTQQTFPLPAGGGQFSAVAATSADNAWAVGFTGPSSEAHGQTLIEHWNGTAWTRVPSPSPAGVWRGLQGVAATGPGNAWAVGTTVTSSGPHKTLILHWNGTAWTRVPSPSPTGDTNLSAVAASSPRDAWAVGLTHPTTCSPRCGTAILHWNGTSWAQVPSPNPPSQYLNTLQGVAALNCHDAWAVGTTDQTSTIIDHWNGKAWS